MEDKDLAIFVACLADFDELCYEDDKTNKLKESLECWSEVCNEKLLQDAKFALVFNGIDLFRAKLQHSNFADCFSDFTGNNTYEECCQFAKSKFLEVAGNHANNNISVHFACAVDSISARQLFEKIIVNAKA